VPASFVHGFPSLTPLLLFPAAVVAAVCVFVAFRLPLTYLLFGATAVAVVQFSLYSSPTTHASSFVFALPPPLALPPPSAAAPPHFLYGLTGGHTCTHFWHHTSIQFPLLTHLARLVCLVLFSAVGPGLDFALFQHSLPFSPFWQLNLIAAAV
jgi:hypothetical protein